MTLIKKVSVTRSTGVRGIPIGKFQERSANNLVTAEEVPPFAAEDREKTSEDNGEERLRSLGEWR